MIRKKYLILLYLSISFFTLQGVFFSECASVSVSVARTIAHALYVITIEVLQEVPLCSYPLPLSYQEFKNIRIKHLKSVYQEGGSCAWYAVCNAAAIDRLVTASKEVEGAAIRKIVEHILVPSLKAESDALVQRFEIKKFFEGISYGVSHCLAQHFNLTNYYTVQLSPKKRWFQLYLPRLSNELSPYVDPSKKYCDMYYVKSPKLFFKKIFSAKQVFHFDLCIPTAFDMSDDHHAVLVTVILAEDGSKPTVIYMDSNNNLLDEDPTWLLSPALYLFFKAMNDALAS